MAAPRRIQLTTLSPYSDVNSPSESVLPHMAGLVTLPAPSPPAEGTLRIELVLFEPDDARCAEFHYPQLVEGRGRGSEELKEKEEEDEDDDDDDDEEELPDLARIFQMKYGEAPKQKKERVQDLVDMGYGYDDTDSFIDNSEAYDELVPASLTTKYGGFYINVGILHFRPASGEENPSDDFAEIKPRKRKLKEGGEVKTSKKKKKRKEEVGPKRQNPKPSVSSVEKKRKARKQQQNLDGMLRKFHKEKLQEFQLFNMKWKESPPASNPASSDHTESVSGDLASALGAADDLHQDGLLSNPQNRESPAETSRTFLPDSFPPAQSVQEVPQDDQLTVLIRKLEEAVVRVMPEQMERYNQHCQAHSEARAAKLEAVKEKRAGEGSDEDEDDASGKRVFAPRKRFRWNEEIRAMLSQVVSVKMSLYELDAAADQSLEDYLKCFLEASVKTLWPRGWMQSRILLIESRRVHAHITRVVARKRSLTVPKSEKGRRGAGVCPGNSGRKFEEILDVPKVSSTKEQSGPRPNVPEVPAACGDVSVVQRLPAEDQNPQGLSGVQRDVYFPPSLLLPFTPAVAAMEGSCGDPALPTPSLSHQTSTPPPESGAFGTATPLHALPFPGLHDSEPAAHTEICTTSSLASATCGTLQYAHSHDGNGVPAGGSDSP